MQDIPDQSRPLQLGRDQRNYVLQVLTRTGWSQTELAKRAGLDPSTLSRFLGSPLEGPALRRSSLQRIQQASGLAFPVSDSAQQGKPDMGFAEKEATLLKATNNITTGILTLLADGAANMDAWHLHSRALELAGYKRGDVLLVQLGATPLKGDVVCAQVYDWPNQRAETIFRLFEPPWLVAATADTALFKPHNFDNPDVAIKGVVIHTLRSRSTT